MIYSGLQLDFIFRTTIIVIRRRVIRIILYINKTNFLIKKKNLKSYPGRIAFVLCFITRHRYDSITGQPELYDVTIPFIIVPRCSIELLTSTNETRNFVRYFIDSVSMYFEESIITINRIPKRCFP